ncbi:MAG TPA: ribonuclease J [Myxococcota bacterium]
MSSVRLTPLGGVGRFGRNCLLVEHDGGPHHGEAIIIDCGVRFPGPELPGFDAALPDLERLAVVGDRLKAIVVTHGHEDHIGALPFVLRDRPLPVYCTPFTSRFIRRRCARFDVDPDIHLLSFGEHADVAGFDVAFAAVSHSIPGAASLMLGTPAGMIVHSGDFRVDDDPILGPKTDLDTLSTAAGERGVRCLLADSTGATTVGKNPGERSVEPALRRCFENADGSAFGNVVVVALFASHLQRLALLAQVCRDTGRKLVLLGRGLEETFKMAVAHRVDRADNGDIFEEAEGGGAAFADVVVDESALRNLPRRKLCIAATGSQGETTAALAKLARRDGSAGYTLEPGDRVVFSARVIPGNDLSVQTLKDAFVDAGIDVVSGRTAPHVSGHGYKDDLLQLLAATRPRTFVALHGAPENLVAHGELARDLGLAREQVVGLRDGHSLVLDDDESAGVRHMRAGKSNEPAAVDGVVCDFPRGIAQVRQRLHSSGVVVVSIDAGSGGDDFACRFNSRGVFPPLDNDVEGGIRHALRERYKSGVSVDDDDAVRAVGRVFKKLRRNGPEIVLVRSSSSASSPNASN